MWYRYILFILLLVFAPLLFAASEKISLDFDQVSLPEVIHVMAKLLHQNVIISRTVQGVATLHLHHADAEQAFMLLLETHGLARWQRGNVWFVAPRDELIKHKQDEAKWQDVANEVAPLQTEVWQVKYGKAEEMARLLHDEQASLLSKRGHVRVDVRTNSLCIQDVSERMAALRRLIRRIDVPVQQILIEARLASVDNDFERELGVKFNVNAPGYDQDGAVSPAKTGHDLSGYSVAVAKLADGSLLDVKLAALENAGHADLISNPSLFTANQQPASIEAGEEVPYQQVSDAGGTAVVFKKAVLGLKVTPQVLPGKKVLMRLQINQDRPSNKTVLGVPVISTRQIMTSVLVADGQTIVLGGIYESNNEKAEQRLPFISEIPLLGLLFKQTNTRQSKRELLIFVTPRIITQAI